jgi:hypothetical protein
MDRCAAVLALLSTGYNKTQTLMRTENNLVGTNTVLSAQQYNDSVEQQEGCEQMVVKHLV